MIPAWGPFGPAIHEFNVPPLNRTIAAVSTTPESPIAFQLVAAQHAAAMSRATAAARLLLDEEIVRPTFRRERRAMRRGLMPVAGCDEAGRGPLAGPVVAAAVILDPDRIPKGLDRSKKPPPEHREKPYARDSATT